MTGLLIIGTFIILGGLIALYFARDKRADYRSR